MSLVGLFMGKGKSGFGYSSTAEQVTEGLSLAGKTMLVTGAGSGLGAETVRVLATGRTVESVKKACGGFGDGVVAFACELSDPSSVRACVEAVKREPKLAAIIANAGIMALPKLEQSCGYERQFFTNHMGHFILITGLLDRLDDAGRVVCVSSGAHQGAPRGGVEFDNLSGEKGYAPWKAYGQSKLCNILFAKELSKHFAGTGKTANSLHPGVIATNLGRSMPAAARAALSAARPLFLKTVPQGAATQTFVATHPSLAGVSGEYFSDCNVARPTAYARDPDLAARLWTTSRDIAAQL